MNLHSTNNIARKENGTSISHVVFEQESCSQGVCPPVSTQIKEIMKRVFAIYFILIVLFVSCNKENHQMFSLRKDFIDAIELYVRNDTDSERHYSYIIIPCSQGVCPPVLTMV